MKSICVFCGSSKGSDPTFIEAAKDLGLLLAKSNITLVYGGASVGLMGEVSSTAYNAGGKVIGVLPKFLQFREIVQSNLTELILVETMHERKTKMFERSEGFIALPGGFGTLEEVVEILTWQQLGLHKFPVAFLNVNGYYDHLQKFFDEMERTGLLKPELKQMALFADSPGEALEKMRDYRPTTLGKWIDASKT